MITLYLTHFRGFDDTFIPLDEVNFLVGENSTGKSSALMALRVFCGHGAWVLGYFQANDEVVGGFNDFTSNEATWFQIGCFRSDDDSKSHYDAVLLTFTGRGSEVPFIADVRLLTSGKDVHFHYEDEELFHKEQKSIGSPEETFREWVKIDPFLSEGLDQIAIESSTLHTPLGMITALYAKESASYAEQMRAQDQVRSEHHQEFLKAARTPSRGSALPTLPDLPHLSPPEMLPTFMHWLESVQWHAPIRAKPRRSYNSVAESYSSEGDHVPWRLRSLSDVASWRKKLRDYGERSGLYDDVEIRKFGNEEDAPFELRVRFGEHAPNVINVGYGVSQVLPLVTSVLEPSLKGTWFALQQPEVHLHPRAQAALGELLFEMTAAPHNKRFLVETHSDYLLDRFRFRMRKAAEKSGQTLSVQVLFFERVGGKNIVHRLRLAPDGEYPEAQPDAFRAFFLEQELQNLGY